MDVFALFSTPTYRPTGTRQAFDSGRIEHFRPDLTATPQLAKEWRDFQRDYRVHHSVTNGNGPDALDAILNSGGQMAPTTDKLRRGISPGGMSPVADLDSGGGSYFFTRIKSNSSASKDPGFVWKAETVARLDAKSYGNDRFGRVTDPAKVEAWHTGSVEGWRQHARTGNNETIFKEGLSIFDRFDAIIASNAAEKAQYIAVLQKHEYTAWPDGRTFDDVIRIAGT